MVIKGQKINDRYEIMRSIGEGGMANVYLAHDLILDRDVAIKILRGDLTNDEKFVRRFQREALSASRISHPNIVEMYDVGEDNGDYYIVMEYVEGITLKQLLKKRVNLTLSEVIDIMLQLTEGMSHAHDSYIIHRDLKPQNIMIKDDGMIKIMDFGIAMAMNSTQLTQTNSVMGSVHYLPPEQASGKGSTIKSDIYSMGIIFYELLTGKLPFKGDNAVEIALKHMKEPLPSAKQHNDSIPQSIENIILKSTAKNPKNRYNDTKELHEDLATCLDDERSEEPVYAYPYPEHEADENTKKINDLKDTEEKEEELIAKPIVDEGIKKGNKVILILLIIFGVIIIGITGMFLVIPAMTSIPDVTVPDVTNLSIVDAEEKLKEAGFEVDLEIEQIESSEVDKGKVVKTEPQSGRSVKEGSVITLYESLGQAIYIIEDYTGQNYIEIQTTLEKIHKLVVKIETQDYEGEEEVTEQTIVGQSLEVGTEVKEGDSIILYIPNIKNKYPNMVEEQWSKTEVETFCTEKELNCEIEEVETTDTNKIGVVFYQSRDIEDDIVIGANFTVRIGIEPKPGTPEEEPQTPSTDTTTPDDTNTVTPTP